MLLLGLVGFFAAVFLAVFLSPSGSLLNTPQCTSWKLLVHFLSIYCFLSIKDIYIYLASIYTTSKLFPMPRHFLPE